MRSSFIALCALAIVVLGSATAHANKDAFVVVGLGPAVAKQDPGWALRIEGRWDATARDDDDDDGEPLFGGRYGLEVWSAGDRKGFAMPIGFYAGGAVKRTRASIGGGIGLWAFEKRSDSDTHVGFAPYASTSLEIKAGNLLLTLDGRVARQVVFETADYNVYSVMFMVGRRAR